MGLFKKLIELQKEANKQAKKTAHMVNVTFDYIGGHPKISGKKVLISKGNKSGQVRINNKMFVDLVNYGWGEQSTRSAGKAAAGAIVGGVLTGGVGLIAGAAMGGKKKDNSILTISVKDASGSVFNIQIRADQNKYNEFTKKVLG